MDVVPLSDAESGEPFDGVLLAQLAAGDEMSVQHYRIAPGAVVEEHSHPHEQAGVLVQGTLRWTVGGEEVVTEAGDSYVIPGGEPHEVVNEGEADAVGIELFSPPRAETPWE